MKVLILGGTGAMGRPLVKYLSKNKENDVYVISRRVQFSYENNVHYIQGNTFAERLQETAAQRQTEPCSPQAPDQ